MSAEHRAVLVLLALAAGGQGIRYLLTRPGDAPGSVRILADDRPGTPLAHRDSAVHLARPLAPGERVDIDRASAAELARLPRVGPGLARAIVSYREAHGSFGVLSDLDSVPGIGPALLLGLAGHLSFPAGRVGASRASPARTRDTLAAPAPVDLNSGGIADLDRLPGIGPAKAQAIVAYRDAHGPFGSTTELARVPGISRALAARLQDLAVVR